MCYLTYIKQCHEQNSIKASFFEIKTVPIQPFSGQNNQAKMSKFLAASFVVLFFLAVTLAHTPRYTERSNPSEYAVRVSVMSTLNANYLS